ncbi:MAG: OadG family transporter subunit [Akkermansia sp.]|nr:OadG family protein [Akkermansia sp.]MEE1266616.1 OadG family transporter subunit [Akkermansia sp.]
MIQTLAALDMDAVIYQVTGMCVVVICLSFLSVMLTISGAVAQRLDAKRKAQAEAAKAAVAPAPVAAPVVAPELPPAQVAAIAAGIYDAAQSSITPQVVAAIAAAVKVTVGNEARILDIKPVDTAYGQGGRAAAMNNSPVR